MFISGILVYILFETFNICLASTWDINLNIIKQTHHKKDPTSMKIKLDYTTSEAYIYSDENLDKLILNNSIRNDLDENLLRFLFQREKSYSKINQLDLQHSQIVKFPIFMLNSLFTNLKLLNLSNNSIQSLSSSRDFSSILSRSSIESLDLSNNQISQIDDETFVHLKELRYLNLNKNQIKHISLFAFTADSHKLVELDLSHNMITDSSLEFLLFSSLVNLKRLNMNYNRLTSLSSHFLYNLYSLEYLSLKFNNLKTFDIFYLANKNNEFLKQIDLSFNLNLKFIQQKYSDQSDEFKDSSSTNVIPNNVEILDLAGIDLSHLNMNKFLDSLFENYKNLESLNLSSTRLKSSLWSSKWPLSIETIDLSENMLKDSQFDCLQFESISNGLRLKLIDLRSNRLRHFHQFIDSCSNILNKFFRANKQVELTVDLRHNQFESLNYLSTHSNSNVSDLCKYEPNQSSLLLSGNPLVCDCDENVWWSSIDDSSSLFYVKKEYCLHLKDYNELSCASMSSSHALSLASYNLKPAESVPKDNLWKIERFRPISNQLIAPELLCPYKYSCSAKKCECCGFRACDCSSHCPVSCKCVRDFANLLDLVNCTSANLTLIPNYLPSTTTEIRLDKNNLRRVHPYQFFGRFRLNLIDLSENQLGFIEENSFHGLNQLRVLKLSDNNLQILLGYEFRDLSQLEELYLDDNKIQFISNLTFSSLINLKVLNLLNNNLRHLLETKIYFEFNVNLLNLSLDNRVLSDLNSVNRLNFQNKKIGNFNFNRKKFDDNLYIPTVKSFINLKANSNQKYSDYLVNCILNKFKLRVQFEIKNNRTFRASIGLSKSLNFDDLDPKILKLILYEKMKKLKLTCEDDYYYENLDENRFIVKPKMLAQAQAPIAIENYEEEPKPSIIVLNLNTILFGLVILFVSIIFISFFLAYLINKYKKNIAKNKNSCLKILLKSLEKKLERKKASQNEYLQEIVPTTDKPAYDLFMVYNKVDSDLVNKLISPILRSKPYNFKVVLQHEKSYTNKPECLTRLASSASFVLFVLSKNLFTDVEYDLSARLEREKS